MNDSVRATLSVHSGIPGVKVYSDTTFLGVTPVDGAKIDSGMHVLRFLHPDSRLWLQPAIVESVKVHPGEHIVRIANFPVLYHLSSEPYGATVRLRDSIAGQTPLDLSLQSEKTFVTLSMDGFDDETVPLTGETREVHVLLHSRTGNPADANGYLSVEKSKSSFPLYVTTGATVVTGIAAAYWKIKADNYYHEYRLTGDASSLDRTRRLDVVSGIFLAASEFSLITLTYFLLSK
jgi:hypothetical protein